MTVGTVIALIKQFAGRGGGGGSSGGGLVVETEWFTDASLGVGFKTTMSAADVASAFKAGKNVVFHCPTGDGPAMYMVESDIYLNLIGYVDPYDSGGTTRPAGFYIADLNDAYTPYYQVVIPSFNYTTITPDGKLLIKIYVD